jgi:hypothetical protein
VTKNAADPHPPAVDQADPASPARRGRRWPARACGWEAMRLGSETEPPLAAPA